MPTIYVGGKPIEINENDFNQYNRLFTDQSLTPAMTQDTGGGIGVQPQGLANPPQKGSLESYFYSPSDPTSGYAAQGLAGMGAGGAALYMSNPALGAAGLWLGLGSMYSNAVQGPRKTPLDYRTMTPEARKSYLQGMMDNPIDRFNAHYRSPVASEDPNRDLPSADMLEYLSKVQPYEDQAYYNPGSQDQGGKIRSAGLANWARQQISGRWQQDMDAIRAQQMAQKYGLALPDQYKNRGLFQVDFSRGY